MLIDATLPVFDVTHVTEVEIDAPTDVAYDAIMATDLRDPLVEMLVGLRELPNRISRAIHHEEQLPPPPALTFRDLTAPGTGWSLLAEEPGVEVVVGLIGQFWHRDFGIRHLAPVEFSSFDEPGYAKLAVSFRVMPNGKGGSILRYEARTATTDDVARRRFRRYWRVIHPGVALLMHRAATLIRVEAEESKEPATSDWWGVGW
jgi:hypothetical protein